MAAGGGGAWKVAYADFVTAMMAFFLVMWLCSQDQKVKREISNYFTDPFAASKIGDKASQRSGAVADGLHPGSVPQSESVDLGRGRNSYTFQDEASLATKLVSDWVHKNEDAYNYWREQAALHRQFARSSKHARSKSDQSELAIQRLAKQLKAEISGTVTAQTNGLCRDLLREVVTKVNWNEISEDLLTN